MIQQLRELVNQTNVRVLGQVLKSRVNHELYAWVLTQTAEIMNSLGYLRIYDAGNYKFQWRRQP